MRGNPRSNGPLAGSGRAVNGDYGNRLGRHSKNLSIVLNRSTGVFRPQQSKYEPFSSTKRNAAMAKTLAFGGLHLVTSFSVAYIITGSVAIS
ncbi:MAG: DUF2061 domain-containing protein, partial [Pigmentiphaga sp.]|nr:DUF2061 domain-containing protein [Pigmentiphaga sp.]